MRASRGRVTYFASRRIAASGVSRGCIETLLAFNSARPGRPSGPLRATYAAQSRKGRQLAFHFHTFSSSPSARISAFVYHGIHGLSDRSQWIDNDEGLYPWWKRSRKSKRAACGGSRRQGTATQLEFLGRRRCDDATGIYGPADRGVETVQNET